MTFATAPWTGAAGLAYPGTVRAIAWLTLAAALLGGCSLQSGNKGATCTRSAQCVAGLACVSGRCSDNLSSIAKQSDVPMLMSADAATGDDAGGG